MSSDLLVKNAVLPDGTVANIGCSGGKITAVGRDVLGEAGTMLDANGQLVAPPFVDRIPYGCTLSLGRPRMTRRALCLRVSRCGAS